jgi:hypothetical protein
MSITNEADGQPRDIGRAVAIRAKISCRTIKAETAKQIAIRI